MISPDRRDDQCYNCSGFGHYSRDCPFCSSPRILGVLIVVRWVIFNAGVRMPDKIGFVDHQTTHLRKGETNSKLHHQLGIAIKITQDGVRLRIAA